MDNILSGITELIVASGFEDEITQILHCQLDEEEITGIFQSGNRKLGYRISSDRSTVFELGTGDRVSHTSDATLP